MIWVYDVLRWIVLAGSACTLGLLAKVAYLRHVQQQNSVKMLTPVHTALAWIALVAYVAVSTFGRLGQQASWRLPLALFAIGYSIFSLLALLEFLNE